MVTVSYLVPILQCPVCQSSVRLFESNLICVNANCINHLNAFPVVENKLVLIDFENSLTDYSNLIHSGGVSPIQRRNRNFRIINLIRNLINPYRKISIQNLEDCRSLLSEVDQPKVLIIGGGSLGFGCIEFLSRFDGISISLDVYYSAHIDLIADASSIPFRNETFDLVIIQAVLEHVFNPYKVAIECERVIKANGLIYSEIPFLQHVHEGAYDFTRFTPLGHRVLFKEFSTIKSGPIGGSGLSLLWSIENHMAGIFRSRLAGKIAKLLLIWIVIIEKIIPKEWNNDGACASYFLGRKTSRRDRVDIKTYLRDYAGVQR